MNKKIIAIAIATAMAAPVAMADVKVSGRVNYNFTNHDTDGASEDVRNFTDNGHARIQFDAKSGNVFGRIARDARTDKNLSNRDQYIGYKFGGGMSVQAGRMANAGKNAEKDPYIATFLETRTSIANSNTATKYGSNGFVDNLVQLSMKAGGVKIKVQYDATENGNSNNSGHVGIGLAGKAGAVNYHVSYNNATADGNGGNSANTNSPSNIKAGANMKFGKAKVGLMYTSMDKDASATAVAGESTDSILVDANFGLGSGMSVNAGYGVRDGEVAADDADYFRLAFSKKLSKGATFYAGYTSTDYDANSASADTSEVGVGMTLKF